MNDCVQLDLFGDFSQPESKTRKLSAEVIASKDGSVRFRYSSKLKRSIRCNGSAFFGKPEVVLPLYMQSEEFSSARQIAAEWANYAMCRNTAKNKEIVKSLVERFWNIVKQVFADNGKPMPMSIGRLPPIKPKGIFYDLDKILLGINETCFENKLTCRITWSNRIGGLSFHSIRKDPATGESFHLISISRGYDAANCPEYAVAGVVYHECLHIVIPPETKNGRRVVHGKDFRRLERQYIYYDEWMKWHKQVLPINIRKMRKNK